TLMVTSTSTGWRSGRPGWPTRPAPSPSPLRTASTWWGSCTWCWTMTTGGAAWWTTCTWCGTGSATASAGRCWPARRPPWWHRPAPGGSTCGCRSRTSPRSTSTARSAGSRWSGHRWNPPAGYRPGSTAHRTSSGWPGPTPRSWRPNLGSPGAPGPPPADLDSCGGDELLVPQLQPLPIRALSRRTRKVDPRAVHLLPAVPQHRPVDLGQDVSAHVDHVVGPDADDVHVVRGMMDLAESEPVGNHRVTPRVPGRQDVSRVEQRRVAQAPQRAPGAVGA